ncbi:Flagellar hook-basal body complex protein FliE [Gammaproteobacteria bacterium]
MNQIQSVVDHMHSVASIARGALSSGTEETSEAATGAANFSQLLRQAIDSVNQVQQTSQHLTGEFEKGTPGVDLPDVMVAVQKANITFQAMTQVRNKLVGAYQEVMGMQV